MSGPRLIALADQLGSSLRSLAPVLAEYHVALVESGLTREEALSLVRDYQGWLLSGAPSAPDESQGA